MTDTTDIAVADHEQQEILLARAWDELHAVSNCMRTPGMPAATVASAVEALLQRMRAEGMTRDAAGLPAVDHLQTDNRLYARTLRLPAGTFAIGEIQRDQHINILVKGRIAMLNPTGGTTEVTAPATFVGQPGVRKCGIALEDVEWLTVHQMTHFPGDPQQAAPERLEHFIAATTAEDYRLGHQPQEALK